MTIEFITENDSKQDGPSSGVKLDLKCVFEKTLPILTHIFDLKFSSNCSLGMPSNKPKGFATSNRHALVEVGVSIIELDPKQAEQER